MRAEIVAAAWALAEEHGVAGLSLREVARSVGMRAPSLYTYVESKDALYDLMFAEGFAALGTEAQEWESAVAGLPREAALTEVIERWIRFCQSSVARYQLLFTRAVPGWVPSPQAYEHSLVQYRAMSGALAPLGIEDAADLDLFTAVTSGLAAQQLANDPDGDRWIRLAPTAARMLLDNLDGRKP